MPSCGRNESVAMLERESLPDAIIERKSISDQVYEHIKRLILSGALEGGEKIPESRVAEQLQVSRTPVREAIRKLAEYGLVVIKPRSYAFVASIDMREARDIATVRLALERLSFRTVAPMATPELLAPLHELASRCDEANRRGDYASVHEADSAIHLGIARRTGNAELFNMLTTLDAKFQLVRLKQHLPSDKLSSYLAQHEMLVSLLERNAVQEIDELLEQHILHHLSFLEAV